MRTACAALTVAMLQFFSRPAFSQDAAPAEKPSPTFAYTRPADEQPLRAVLEGGGVLAAGFAWYAITSRDSVQDWDVNYHWETFRRKITGQAFGPDTNHFGTNFIGHPFGGTGYYLAARSNRLSILQSLGYSFAGSLLWELFGEVSEIVSLNDAVVTPLGGLAIGEATTQLGAFFDRSEGTTTNRILGATFGPLKTLNDGFDGLEPVRAKSGFPANEWHRFELSTGLSVTREDARTADDGNEVWPEVRFGLSSRLVRLPGYRRSGRGLTAFDDGNVSSMSLTGAAGEAGLTDLAFRSSVVLAGGYYRARSLDRDGAPWGANGIFGVASAFQYTLHDYERAQDGGVDRIAAIEPLDFSFEQRGALGGPEITTRLDAGPSFGGVTPLAARDFRGDRSRFPPVLAARSYYFGLGGHLGVRVLVESGPLEAGGELRGEAYRAVGGPREAVDIRIEDLRSELSGWLGYRVKGTPLRPTFSLVRRARMGRLGTARAATAELGAGATLDAVF